jgi:hypothetical protein
MQERFTMLQDEYDRRNDCRVMIIRILSSEIQAASSFTAPPTAAKLGSGLHWIMASDVFHIG